MWWIMHSPHCLFQRQYYLWQTSASDFLPEDRWKKFYTFFRKYSSVRQTQLFLETLSCNPPYWGSKFFFFNLSCFNPRSLRARSNPQMQLMKLLWLRRSHKIPDKKQSLEQREHRDQMPRHTLESKPNWGIRVESRVLYIMPFCSILPQTWTLSRCSVPPHPEINPALNIALEKRKSMIHPISAVQLIMALLGTVIWKCHTINQF